MTRPLGAPTADLAELLRVQGGLEGSFGADRPGRPVQQRAVDALRSARMHQGDVAESLRRALAGRDDVGVALLFGSRARGRARDDSDVDLAVLAPGVDAAARWRSHALTTLEVDGPWYARMSEAWLRRVAERAVADG